MTRLDTFLTRCLDVLAALRAQLGRKGVLALTALATLLLGLVVSIASPVAAGLFAEFCATVAGVYATFAASNAAISRVAAANGKEDPDARP